MLVENRQGKRGRFILFKFKGRFSTPPSSTSDFFSGLVFNLLEVKMNITRGKTVQLQNLLTPLLLHTPNLSQTNLYKKDKTS